MRFTGEGPRSKSILESVEGQRRTLISRLLVSIFRGTPSDHLIWPGLRLVLAISCGALGLSGQSAVMGVWSPVGDLRQARRFGPVQSIPPNSAIVELPGRQTLIAGGTREGHALDSAAIFDRTRGQCRTIMGMRQPRSGHSATLLADGRVLIAGGGSRSLEIFDPNTGQWVSLREQLSVARSFHTASLLADGRVLIAGGSDGRNDLASAEYVDPVAGTVSPAAFLTVARSSHSATVLFDGRILIAGGSGLASTEIYDPVTQAFSASKAMSAARSRHAAILLPDNNQVLLAGGTGDDGEPLDSAELYDPWTGTFRTAASMIHARAQATARANARGEAMVSGGSSDPEIFHFPTILAVGSANGSAAIDGAGWQPGEKIWLSGVSKERSVSARSAVAEDGGKFQAQVSTHGALQVEAHGPHWRLIGPVTIPTSTAFTIDTCAASQYGFPTTLEVTVGPSVVFPPTGTVSLSNNGVTLQTQPLDSVADAIFTLDLPGGNDSLVATYSGDSSYGPSTSQTLNCTVAAVGGFLSAGATSSVIYGQTLQATASYVCGLRIYGPKVRFGPPSQRRSDLSIPAIGR